MYVARGCCYTHTRARQVVPSLRCMFSKIYRRGSTWSTRTRQRSWRYSSMFYSAVVEEIDGGATPRFSEQPTQSSVYCTTLTTITNTRQRKKTNKLNGWGQRHPAPRAKRAASAARPATRRESTWGASGALYIHICTYMYRSHLMSLNKVPYVVTPGHRGTPGSA